ncbi:DNA repair exonuclease SbcCD ATPase subunit [Haloferula luteola]|uniref:DNA repair exonuclease SbcCD ATPase subunit n=1 Tax=Haloferula luteola TaxID=595692 RepID=A0A840V3A3_9BACT|nr:AAA family ATPase [Haloferula luteola]MBB5351973.1 DNA repair exonuclease SbcCD ATPase subunit [Haloferula luteola]
MPRSLRSPDTMRLLILTLRNYRVHREISISLDRSRTLIGGPNESGKSTLVEAAHRALFLRAKTGGNLQREMLSTLHPGDPEVVLEFEAAGKCWELEKRFAGPRGSTRLREKGGATWRDDEADSKLAELLKCEIAGGRGAAGTLPDLWSHVWVWQGRSGEDPSSYTHRDKDRLVQHLQPSGASVVLPSVVDQGVVERISNAYETLFTAKGKWRAQSPPELARIRRDEQVEALSRASEVAARLAQAADDQLRADREICEVQAALPKLRRDLQLTEEQLQRVATLRRDEAHQQEAADFATARRVDLETQELAIRRLDDERRLKAESIAPAEAALKPLTDAESSAISAYQEAERAQFKALEMQRSARQHHDLVQASLAVIERSELLQRLLSRSRDAAALQEQLATRRSRLAQLPELAPRELSRLRQLESEAARCSAALEAMAAGVELIATQELVQLDGESLKVGELRILTGSGELQVGDRTRLRIQPGGGTTLASTRDRHLAACRTLSSALEKHTLRDLDHAVEVVDLRQSLEQEMARLETRWMALGGAGLATDLAQASVADEAAREELRRRVDAMDSAPSLPSDGNRALHEVTAKREALRVADETESRTRRQLEHAVEKRDAATAASARQREEVAAVRQSLRDLETALRTREETHGDEASRRLQRVAATELEARAIGQLAATRKSLVDHQPEQLSADLERFRRALATQESRLRDAENTRLLSRDRLILDGSHDPNAELLSARARHAAAELAHRAESRRAEAIELLHELFTSSRDAIDRAMVRPLADRISGYLQCLFGPGTEARVVLTDQGIENLELVRPNDPSFSFSTLSGGAREQVAAAVRLALAEILAADHDGCLPVVLDDAFAYSDPERISGLQRMLDLAALRGLQILILSCHPSDYVSFGAHEIRLSSR